MLFRSEVEGVSGVDFSFLAILIVVETVSGF